MGIIQNLLEKGFSAFYKKISFLPQSFSTKEFSAYEPDASDFYYNGRVADEGNIDPNTSNNSTSYNPTPADVPPWFSW